MSLNLDGVDDYVATGAVGEGDAFSFSFWMNLDGAGSSGAGIVVCHGGGSDIRWYLAIPGQADLVAQANNGSYRVWSTPNLGSFGVWTFVCLTFDNIAANLLTAVPVIYCAAPSIPMELHPPNLTIGGNLNSGTHNSDGGGALFGTRPGGSQVLDGRIAEMTWWPNKILTPGEVSAVYMLGSLSVTGALGYWPFYNGTLLDFSGRGRTVSTNGGPTVAGNPPTRLVGRRG